MRFELTTPTLASWKLQRRWSRRQFIAVRLSAPEDADAEVVGTSAKIVTPSTVVKCRELG